MRTARLVSLVVMAALAFGCTGGESTSRTRSRRDAGSAAIAGPSTEEASLANEVFVLVNQERSSRGLRPFDWDEPLARVAWAHSADMSDRQFFDHMNPEGLDPFERLDAAGLAYSTAGENIAQGYATAAEAMTGWMNSPGHRANILSTQFTTLGVGVKQGGEGGPYWTQDFLRP